MSIQHNKEMFQNIIRKNEQGKMIGIPVNDKPEYEEKVKALRREFNNFTNNICLENWELYKVGEYWQMGTPLGSTYKPYFWNQFKHKTYNIDGISIWLALDVNRFSIVMGTTKELNDYDKEDINKLIWEKYSNKEYDKFEKTHTDGYLNYQYKGTDEAEDIEKFKTVLTDICNSYIDLIQSLKSSVSIDDYNRQGFKEYLKSIARQEDGSKYAQTTIDTYVTDLKTILHIFKQMDIYKEKSVEVILNDFLDKKSKESMYLSTEFFMIMQREKRIDNLYQTIVPKASKYIEYIDYSNIQDDTEDIGIDDRNLLTMTENKILYGPPGTGKTYKLQELQKEFENRYVTVTFHQSYGYEEFVEGLKAKIDDDNNVYYKVEDGIFKDICEKAKNDTNNQYAIFIDEINRGNISKIFGELITLIEISKREIVSIILPYSKEPFTVPNNLSIIGTMNTADRSIALLDTALRRRFDFIEMKPIYKHQEISTNINGINIQEVLKTINERIEFLYDRDHAIGHAYFIDCDNFEELQNIFKNKIIPLLEEYFYDDWEKVNLVLNNNGFIKSKTYKQKTLFSNCNFEEFDDDKIIYQLNDDALSIADNYIKIYE